MIAIVEVYYKHNVYCYKSKIILSFCCFCCLYVLKMTIFRDLAHLMMFYPLFNHF